MQSPRRTKYAVGIEYTYGTKSESYFSVGKVNPFNHNQENIFDEVMGLDSDPELQGQVRAEKRFRFDQTITHLENGRILQLIFGSHSEAPSGEYYLHTLTPLNAVYQPSFTIEVAELGEEGEADLVKRYLGTVVDVATFNWNIGEFVSLNLNLISQDIAKDSLLDSDITEVKTYFKAKATTLKIDSGDTIVHNSGNLTITKNHEAEPELDGNDDDLITRPKCGRFDYALSFVRDKENDIMFDYVNDGNDHDIELKFVKGNEYIKFDMTGKFASKSKPIDLGANTIIETINFTPRNVTVEVKDAEEWEESP